MGLTAYPAIREWIRANVPSAVLPAPHANRHRDDCCVRIDLTQKLRQSPPDTTGDEFCRWLWRFISRLPCQYVVAMMDKPALVPREKQALQAERSSRQSVSPFSAASEFGPMGVRHSADGEWHKFSGAEVLACRAARGNLAEWVYQWCCQHTPTEHTGQTVWMEYEPRAVQIGPGLQIGEVPELASTTHGEADMMQLAWLTRTRKYDCIDLQIDSDLLCIALLHLLRTPEEDHPYSWVWVASMHNWTVTQDSSAFCVDLMELYRGLRHDVRATVLSFVLGGTDYYKCKHLLSPWVDFDTMHRSVCETWDEWWRPWWDGDVDLGPRAVAALIATQRRLVQENGRRNCITRVLNAPLPSDAEVATALAQLRFNVDYWSDNLRQTCFPLPHPSSPPPEVALSPSLPSSSGNAGAVLCSYNMPMRSTSASLLQCLRINSISSSVTCFQ